MKRTTSDVLWAWVESDESLHSPEEAVRLACILVGQVTAHLGDDVAMPSDCFCDERMSLRMDNLPGQFDNPPAEMSSERAVELDGRYWRNGGAALRWAARTIRDALAEDDQEGAT